MCTGRPAGSTRTGSPSNYVDFAERALNDVLALHDDGPRRALVELLLPQARVVCRRLRRRPAVGIPLSAAGPSRREPVPKNRTGRQVIELLHIAAPKGRTTIASKGATMGRMLMVAVLALGLAGELFAQGYPVRAIRWIVGFPPGAATDAATRAVATEMAARLGQPIVVENRAGAGGSLGVEQLARAIPDGYTIGTGTSGAVTVNPHLSEKAAFDPLRDLTAVAKIVAVPVVVVAAASAPFNSVTELIAAARAS